VKNGEAHRAIGHRGSKDLNTKESNVMHVMDTDFLRSGSSIIDRQRSVRPVVVSAVVVIAVVG